MFGQAKNSVSRLLSPLKNRQLESEDVTNESTHYRSNQPTADDMIHEFSRDEPTKESRLNEGGGPALRKQTS